MKLPGFRADKLPSLEEGPIRYQNPETVIKTRIAPRSHLERCIQMLKLIFYFELILLIGWIGCLYLSNYYGVPSTVVDVPHKNSNWMDNSDRINGDGFNRENLPPLTGLLTEDHSLKNQLAQSELAEASTSEEDNQAMSVLLLLSMFNKLTHPAISDNDAFSDVNDWEKNEDKVDDESSVIIQDINRDEQIETTTEANMNDDDDSVIAIEKSEIPIIDQTQESAEYFPKWLSTILNTKSIHNDEYLDDSDEWDNWEPKLDDADTPDEEKIIDSSNYFDETELNKPFEDRFRRLMAKIDEDIKERFSDKEELEISPIYLEPYPDRIDDLSDNDSSELPPMQRQVFNSEILQDFPDFEIFQDDYGNWEPYKTLQHDKDDVISRLAREIGTKVDSDSNSSSDEGTTPAPKVKRSAESSSEESSESNEKPQPSDSFLGNDELTEIFNKLLTKYPHPNDPNQNRTRLSEKDFENIVNSLQESL